MKGPLVAGSVKSPIDAGTLLILELPKNPIKNLKTSRLAALGAIVAVQAKTEKKNPDTTNTTRLPYSSEAGAAINGPAENPSTVKVTPRIAAVNKSLLVRAFLKE